MSVAFTFPGQGSQAVGMGKDLADNFAEARAVFEEVDEALGQKLSDIMWSGPEETLTLTDSQFDLTDLDYGCIKIMSVSDSTGEIVYYQDPEGSETYTCNTEEATVDVVYQYYPATLTTGSETPDVPNVIHDAIPHYIVACYRAGGDPDTQSTASIDYQLFNAALKELGTAVTSNPRSSRIKNWY